MIKLKINIMSLLLPHRFKNSSRVLFYLFFGFGIYYMLFLEGDPKIEELFTFTVPALINSDLFSPTESGWIETVFLDEILSICIILFGLLAGFSKEKYEDELIDKLRNDALRISLYASYGILLLTILSIFGLVFLSFLFAQLFLILFLFNLIFDIKLIMHYKSVSNDQ